MRVAIGSRSLAEGDVELKRRAGGEMELVALDEIVGKVTAELGA